MEWNGSMAADEAYTPQDRMNLNGLVSSVSSVRITDRDASGYSDLLVAGDGEVHWLYTTALENRISIPVDENATHVFFAVENGTSTLSSSPLVKTILQRRLRAANSPKT